MSSSHPVLMPPSASAKSPSVPSAHLSALSPAIPWIPKPRLQRQYSSSALEEGPVLHAPRASHSRISSTSTLSPGFTQSWDEGRDLLHVHGDSKSTSNAVSNSHLPPSQFLLSPNDRRVGTKSFSALQSTLISPSRTYSAMSIDDFSMGMAWTPGLGASFGIMPSPRHRRFDIGVFDGSALTPMQRDFPRSKRSSDVMMVPITPTAANMPGNTRTESPAKPVQIMERSQSCANPIRQTMSPPSTGNQPPGGLTISIPSPRLFASSRFGENAVASTGAALAQPLSPPSPSSAAESFREIRFQGNGEEQQPIPLNLPNEAQGLGNVSTQSMVLSSSQGGQGSGSSQADNANYAAEQMDRPDNSNQFRSRGHTHTMSSTTSGSVTFAGSLQGDDMMGKVVIIGPSAGALDALSPFGETVSSEDSMSDDDQQDDYDTASIGPEAFNTVHSTPPMQVLGPGVMIAENHMGRFGPVDAYCSPSRFLQMTLHDPPAVPNTQGFVFPNVGVTSAMAERRVAFSSEAELHSAENSEADRWADGEGEDEDDDDDEDDDAEDDEDEDADVDEDDSPFDEAGNFKEDHTSGTSVSTNLQLDMFGLAQIPSMPSSQNGPHSTPRRRAPGSKAAPTKTKPRSDSRSSVGSQDVQGGVKRHSRRKAAAVRDRSMSIMGSAGIGSSSRQARTASVTERSLGSSSSQFNTSSIISSILGEDEDGTPSSHSRTSSLHSDFSSISMGRDAALSRSFCDDMGGSSFEQVEYHGVQPGLGVLENLSQRCRDARENKDKLPILESFASEWMRHFYEESNQGTVNRAHMNQSYRAACKIYGLHPLNSSNFGRLVRTEFSKSSIRRLGPRGNSRYHYTGLSAKYTGPQETATQGSMITEQSGNAGTGVTSSSSERRSQPVLPKRPRAEPARKNAAPTVPSSTRLPVSTLCDPDSDSWMSSRPELRRTASESFSVDSRIDPSFGSFSNPFPFMPSSLTIGEDGIERTGLGVMLSVPMLQPQVQASATTTGLGGPVYPTAFYPSPIVGTGVELPVFDAGHAGMISQSSTGADMQDGGMGQNGFVAMPGYVHQPSSLQQGQYQSSPLVDPYGAQHASQGMSASQSVPAHFAFGASGMELQNSSFVDAANMMSQGGEPGPDLSSLPFSWQGFSQDQQQQQYVASTSGTSGQAF
ncbi:hypothetical protein A4X13_0g2592 [Tilletia indica]|uniref:Uncharacterized protein n=1 Tax=Tilletia indica TaxID=43049 RepID=A0A177TX69_9BASI|nr:hypothetical protein A4X13_0g2592 [Tilletia indica]